MKNYSTKGKRLLTLDEVSKTLLPSSCEIDHTQISHLNLVNNDPEAWLPIDSGGFWSALPGPEFCPRLYRGQDKRHQSCKASIFRLSTKLEYLIAFSKLLEFYACCEQHPGINFLRNFEIMGKKGDVDMESQAQHYNLSTTILDFSRSLDVAEFFARCRRCTNKPNSEQKWEMIPELDFDGILFIANFKSILCNGEFRKSFILTTPSPFLRPHRQKAVGITIGGKCLTEMPFIEIRPLHFSKTRAMELLDSFSEGQYLFPNETFNTLTSKLYSSKVINIEAFKASTTHVQAPDKFDSLVAEAKKKGYSFVSKRLLIHSEQMKDLLNEWLVVNEEIKKSMKIRLVADSISSP